MASWIEAEREAFAKNAIQEVIKKYWEENSLIIRKGGKMRTIDYVALDYMKENLK